MSKCWLLLDLIKGENGDICIADWGQETYSLKVQIRINPRILLEIYVKKEGEVE